MFQHSQSRWNVRSRIWRLCSVHVERLPVYQHCTLVFGMSFDFIKLLISYHISFSATRTNTDTSRLCGSQRHVHRYGSIFKIFLLYSNASQLQRGDSKLRQSPYATFPDRHNRRARRSVSVCKWKVYAKRIGDAREWHQQCWTVR